ncbi:MAG: hypothetical protein JWP12_1735 [Bacteroidetes bacterium]|nr:hypothetical protein [Bacteroidota bacterium]
MKKITTTLLSMALGISTFAQTEITDTVSLSAGYANQKWYSLANDEQGTAQSKDNWDLGFEITGFSASIIANTQKASFMVYKTPFSIGNFNTLDTAGIAGWPTVFNSDTTWSIGAFNKGITSDPFDLGWGIYDMGTHFVNGDSCFVIKLSAASYKKFKIDNLGNGIYNFTYANIDGSSLQTHALAKATYPNKNFGYYDLTNNTEIDREPATANWDLTFVKYTTFIPSAYGVTGILSNKGLKVAEADNVPSVETYNNYSGATFNTPMNEIGYDWKSFNMSTGAYNVSHDTCYFIQTANGDIWKLRFTGFGGSANGDFMFGKTLLSTTGIEDVAGNTISKFSLYPNPVSNGELHVLFSSEKEVNDVTLTIMDITGKIISAQTMNLTAGFNTYSTSVDELSSGIYMIRLSAPGFTNVQKFVKQ